MKDIICKIVLLNIILSLLTFRDIFPQVNQEWVARYNGTGDSIDAAVSIAVDKSGNVYVTGYSYGSGSFSDYLTIKYNSAGNTLWVARYNGPGNYFDQAS